jgi:hypothetical protein
MFDEGLQAPNCCAGYINRTLKLRHCFFQSMLGLLL